MKGKIKRITSCAVALALICASSLNSVTVRAESEEEYNQWLQSRLISAEGVPDGLHLVVKKSDMSERFGDYDDYIAFVFGEDGLQAFRDVNQKLEEGEYDEGSDEFIQIVAAFYDELGIIDVGDARDFHLEDDDGEKQPYSGSGITIKYEYGDLFGDDDDFSELLSLSSRTWKPALIHIKDDDSIEYIPATVDGVVWTFTATDFSAFMPVLVAEEEEAPKTLDNTVAYTGIAGVGVAGLFVLGAWLGRREKR